MKSCNLISGFLESAQRHASRPALVVGEDRLTYRDLQDRAAQISSAILQYQEDPYPLAAVLASRSITAYAGVLGVLGSGKGYVPLNPKFPVERTQKMLLLSGCRSLIVGREAVAQLVGLLSGIDGRLTVILPDAADAAGMAAAFPAHRFISAREMTAGTGDLCAPTADPRAIAYLLFTSGTTGEPKGVPIHHINACSYVSYIADRYGVHEQDRVSQEFDLTFDLSVHDMFVTWDRGACLYCVPEKSVMLPAKFIREHQLTLWFSVPSVIGVLQRMALLKPGCFPSLRYSLFCGEPLSAAYARHWQQAAPNSILENLYGPTETTIAISHYRWNPAKSPDECENGIVPIGCMFPGQRACIVDSELRPVPGGGSGELCLAGSQVTSGYWNSPEKTRQQFVKLDPNDSTRWYRTGDLIKRSENGCLHYLGRMDHQAKIRGYRVELQEIDVVVKKLCGTEEVVSIPWPVMDGTAQGVVTFVSGVGALDQNRILRECCDILPEYMVPKKILLLAEMPLNVNGKVDRNQLAEMLRKV